MIDASHHLQLEEDDANCALYSLNFVSAITHMLSDPAIADRVYTLAESVKKAPTAQQTLTFVFQEEIKHFLPQYYRQDTKEPRPVHELEEFHLKQRWLMGALSIPLRHPLEEPFQHKPLIKGQSKLFGRDSFFKLPEASLSERVAALSEERQDEIQEPDELINEDKPSAKLE